MMEQALPTLSDPPLPHLERSTRWPAHFGLSLAGHVTFGVCLGLGWGARAVASSALVAPGAITVALVSMLPLLYIALTLRGGAPPLSRVVKAGVVAWRDTGLIMLGAAPAAWFLISSVQDPRAASVLLGLEAFLCARLGLASFRRNALGENRSLLVSGAFFVWGVLVVTMAVRLYAAWVVS